VLKLCREVRGAMGGVATSAGLRCWIFGARESGWLANAGRPARFAVSMAARRPMTFGVILEARRRPMRFVMPVDVWRPRAPNAICDVRGSAAPADVRRNSRQPRTRRPVDCLT
jgi:hypothetical protein